MTNSYTFVVMGIHIGRIIKQHLDESKVSITDFARMISKERSNVYDIFKRESIDTDLLLKIGKALNYNFFKYFEDVDTEGQEIAAVNKKKAKFYIQIEVEDPEQEKEIRKMLNMK